MIDWPPGMKIVCIDDDIRPEQKGATGMDGLRKDAIYTVEHMYISDQFGNVCVKLVEINRPHHLFTIFEKGYCCDRFRPLKDVGKFDHLLTVAPADVMSHLEELREFEKTKVNH